MQVKIMIAKSHYAVHFTYAEKSTLFHKLLKVDRANREIESPVK